MFIGFNFDWFVILRLLFNRFETTNKKSIDFIFLAEKTKKKKKIAKFNFIDFMLIASCCREHARNGNNKKGVIQRARERKEINGNDNNNY